MSNEKKTPTPLFIEDLGQVQGGKPKYTTLALGEEGPITTLALGEEGGGGGSTILGGEEATTLALGEEGGGLPTD
ncbi:MAG: hypothetical protein JNK45_15680 [Myxococcales bacterium]|nr:hypothetical protein [Myxococcales bacterium]